MLQDKTLVARWATRRDAEAFHEIVNRHIDMVYGTCLRVLGNTAEAEDMTQECFLRLAERPPAIRSSLGGWLHRLATHRSFNMTKASARRRVREQRYAATKPVAMEATWDDVKQFLDEAIDQLPEKQRAAIVAHFLERKTHEAIAQELDVSRPAVSQRIQKGVETLRVILKKRGVEIASVSLGTMLAAEAVEAAPSKAAAELGRHALAGVGKTYPPLPTGSAMPLVLKAAAAGVLAAAAVAAIWLLRPAVEPPVVVRQVQAAPVPIEEAPSVAQPPEAVASMAVMPETGASTVVFRCVDQIGAPVAGARVCYVHTVYPESRTESTPPCVRVVQGPLTANKDGLVTVNDVPDREEAPSSILNAYRGVFAWLPGELTGIWQFPPPMTPGLQVFNPGEPVEVIMAPAVALAGQVEVPSDVSPLTVAVEVLGVSANAGGRFGMSFPVYGETYWPELFRFRPDSSGRFVIPQVPSSGNIQLAATAPGLGEAQFATYTPGTEGVAVMTLHPEGAIEGVLERPSTIHLAPDVAVFARSKEHMVSHAFDGVVNGNGTYRIAGLPPGEYVVFAQPRADGGTWVSAPVTGVHVEPGMVTGDIRLTLAEGGLLEGTVCDGSTGGALVGAQVYAEAGGERVAHTETGADGHFSFRLPPGSSNVVASCTGYRYVTETVTYTPAEAPMEPLGLRLAPQPELPARPTFTVAGRVVDSMGKPAVAAMITDHPKKYLRDDGTMGGHYRAGATGPDGRYQVTIEGAGQHRIQAGGEPYSAAVSDWFPPPAEGELELPDLVVTRYDAELSGLVVDPEGAPVVNARIDITAPGYDCLNLSPKTNREGRFYAKHLPEDAVEVCISREGYGYRCETLMPGADYEFVLRPQHLE